MIKTCAVISCGKQFETPYKNLTCSPACRKQHLAIQRREYEQRPEIKALRQQYQYQYRQRPESKARQQAYQKAYRPGYKQRPGVLERKQVLRREDYERGKRARLRLKWSRLAIPKDRTDE